MSLETQVTATLYGPVTTEVFNRAKNIRLLVCDIDGVFSDGYIYLGNDGEELKAFNTKDGFGIKAVGSHGVDVAVITGRQSNIVEARMRALNVKFILQGKEDKMPHLQAICQQQGIALEHVAYIGDDVPDLPCIEQVGLGVAVQDAHPLVKQSADHITTLGGGKGAVRELCDLIMQAQNTLHLATGSSV
ncbi:3-deoxy-manno-octulosonate-8-phosphatase KdsC [Thalassotalea maritima]|uniref:3-deoxy-manno-octulosonate-8-phosphatase KdsC n=1 Tax=Thalassotalea maritima TaxID=3242416 RepID=UPI0035290D78